MVKRLSQVKPNFVVPAKVSTRRRARDPILDELLNVEQGRAAELARILGITRQTLYGWTRVPKRHLAHVAALWRVSPHKLRPDLRPSRMLPPAVKSEDKHG